MAEIVMLLPYGSLVMRHLDISFDIAENLGVPATALRFGVLRVTNDCNGLRGENIIAIILPDEPVTAILLQTKSDNAINAVLFMYIAINIFTKETMKYYCGIAE